MPLYYLKSSKILIVYASIIYAFIVSEMGQKYPLSETAVAENIWND